MKRRPPPSPRILRFRWPPKAGTGATILDRFDTNCRKFARSGRSWIRGGPLKRELLPIALISCLLVAGPCHASRRSIKGQVKPEEPATPPAPTPPPTLEQTPASPPVVTFRDGELTIAATNSTLADILKAVRTQTGAEVDVPGNPTDRVVGQFGPGPARDVLGSLLNGSHFNYVLLGSATNPNALDRVILMAKSAAPVPQSGAPEQANAGYAPTAGIGNSDVGSWIRGPGSGPGRRRRR